MLSPVLAAQIIGAYPLFASTFGYDTEGLSRKPGHDSQSSGMAEPITSP